MGDEFENDFEGEEFEDDDVFFEMEEEALSYHERSRVGGVWYQVNYLQSLYFSKIEASKTYSVLQLS